MATVEGVHVFETKLGWVGIAWTAAGISHLQLPGRDHASTARMLASRAGSAAEAEPPPFIEAAVAMVKRYADGERVDFSAVPVDLDGIDDFRLAVYAAARRLGFGETTTYGGLAGAAGHPGMAREVGEALGRNPVPIIVPCHRIVAAGGKVGGFSAPGGSSTKQRLLANEGVLIGPPRPAQAALAF